MTGYWAPAEEPPASEPVQYPPMVRRTPRGALEWLAEQLMLGTDPGMVALALIVIARELDGVEWPEKVAPPPPPV